LAWILPVFDSILWLTVRKPHWNNGFSQRWLLSGLSSDIRHDGSFQPETDARKLVLIWNRIRIKIFDLNVLFVIFGIQLVKQMFDKFRPLGESCTLQSFIYYLRKHLFSFLFHSESIYALLKTHFWVFFGCG